VLEARYAHEVIPQPATSSSAPPHHRGDPAQDTVDRRDAASTVHTSGVVVEVQGAPRRSLGRPHPAREIVVQGISAHSRHEDPATTNNVAYLLVKPVELRGLEPLTL